MAIHSEKVSLFANLTNVLTVLRTDSEAFHLHISDESHFSRRQNEINDDIFTYGSTVIIPYGYMKHYKAFPNL